MTLCLIIATKWQMIVGLY